MSPRFIPIHQSEEVKFHGNCHYFDLHIGQHDQTDRFGLMDYEFLRFLTFLNRIFTNRASRDVFETLTGRKYGQRMSNKAPF